MIDSFENHIDSKLSFLKTSKLLLAISGGIDSVVLTHLCHKMGLNIALAHCNFNLRGKESDADEDFVLQLAEDLELEVFIENFETEAFANDEKISIQMAARTLRYHWFLELTEQLKFDYVLTAHHADDNLETFFINLSRGTGLDGLLGIPEVNNNIVRPLLPYSREEIENYVKEHKLKWREDSSNISTKYLRNKLRHDVIPILKEMNPHFLQNFAKTQMFLNDSKFIIEDKISIVSQKAIKSIDEYTVALKIEEIKNLSHPIAYLHELLKDFGFTEWHDVFKLLDAQSGKYVKTHTHRLIKDRDCLLLSKIHTDDSQTINISETDKIVDTPFGVLFLDEVDTVLETHKMTIYVDKDLLKFPLIIRKWEKGDTFYPLGMTGKKKLSKYFKDEKFSLLDKENAWLLCSGDAIVWVINKRADNRFRVTENSKSILKFEIKYDH
ncbi:tRNA lysidine(34) synthetase TilS [Mariniflexile soesokkakense]|uniref:tRNA(Ile)-lysidine synthase n=1 Tax=Mariniflexile soesokkakense TaxID=1343160 RepID=A0ABV0A771_9FLAO